MPDEYEREVAKCNNLTELRRIAEGKQQLVDAVKDSLSPVKVLLCKVFSRLQLKEKPIRTYISATPQEISELWTAIISFDSTLEEGAKYVKGNIGEHEKISEFLQHCCRMDQYTFDVLKCGKDTCNICLPRDVFHQIKHIPFPIPGEGHYLRFAEV